MRTSYLLRSWNRRLSLLPQILDQLHIERECVLHGVRADDEPEAPSAILSPLPLDSWRSAHRVVVYTAASPGSLAGVMKHLSEREINILSAWCAAFSSTGETCLTAVVELPKKFERRAGDLDKLRNDLEQQLEREGLLSRSKLFGGAEKLRRVRVVKMRVLSELARLHGSHGECRIKVSDWTLDLREVWEDSEPLSQLFRLDRDADGSLKSLMLLTPDTEECYFRLSPMRESRYRNFSFVAEVLSTHQRFSGFFERAINTLAAESINVYSAQTVVLDKTKPKPGEKRFSERAMFRVTGDLNGSRLGHVEDEVRAPGEQNLKDRVLRATREAFGERASELDAGVTVKLSNFKVTPLLNDRPLVFVATNAKPTGMLRRHRDMAVALLRRLKYCNLQPVNVDVSTAPSLKLEVERLLDLCPILVSLFLPEPGNRLHGAKDGAAAHGPSYAPSDYTMYEEAYMSARGRIVLRLRHEDVFGPRYLGDQSELVFDDRSFERVLQRASQRLRRILSGRLYNEIEERCQEGKRNAPGDWNDRDVEAWLLGEAPRVAPACVKAKRKSHGVIHPAPRSERRGSASRPRPVKR